ncbi:MAG: transcriptional regulator [Candidatus Diapherotrites archaeon]|nr:transcriptional regulator [Candidatus Diapherotrites archaeon]
MVELTDNEKKVADAMKALNATGEDSAKTANIIAGKCPLPKGLISNLLTQMAGKGAVKRVAKSKAGVYYLVQQ